jgi:parallel beta-helix repeat protein
MRDIDGGDRNNILKLSASGITIDGGGHVIKGSSSGFTSGIYVDGGTILKDVHIKNCIFEGVDFGVWFYRVESGSIQNCTLKNCKNIGIRMDQSRLNTVSDNTLTDNVLGMGLFQSAGNIVTNNFFKNQFNAAANDDQRNTWNTDIQNTRNIVGGQLKGGNVWLDLNGSGFSTSTPDGNHDGIADAPYTINGYNIDFFPLTLSGSQVSEPQSEPITSEPSGELIPEDSIPSPNVSTPNIQEESKDGAIIAQNDSANPPESQINLTLSNSGNADIRIIDLSAPENACIAGEFPVNMTIENQGDLDAKYFSVYYYLSDDSGITPSDISLGSHLFEIIHPQEKLDVQDVITVPQGTAVKAYTVGAIADPANDIYEKNKQNNILAVSNRIQMETC